MKSPRPFLEAQPGHYIRRLQQIAVAIFLEDAQAFGVTPVQFAALVTVLEQPGLDQRTLARTIGLDASTIGAVTERLERRRLIRRSASAADLRVRVLTLTEEGERLVKQMIPGVLNTQQRILGPLAPQDRKRFLKMLATIVEANNGLSRAPKLAGRPKRERR